MRSPKQSRGPVPWRVPLLLGVGLLCCSAPEQDVAAQAGPETPRRTSASPRAGPLTPADVDRANAVDYARQPAEMEWSGGDAERGAGLYMQACWICHGAAGRGEGPAAASLNPKPRDFREGRFYIDANANDETGEAIDLARVILVGAEAFGGSELMQGWHEVFTPEEVRNLVAYIESLAQDRG